MNALCLVRHAIAEERGPAWPDDRLRPLTRDGRLKMEQAAAGLARISAPGVVLTSPLVRARQTAEIVAAALAGAPIVETPSLANGDHSALLQAAESAGTEIVYAVGHEPHISMAASWFLCGDESGVSLEVKKGSAILLAFPGRAAAGTAMLEWALAPRILRALAEAAKH